MTEFDYDVRQRKQLVSGSRYKKRGSKSKKCSLPSDNITNKQWKERNGSVKVIKMNEPMKWEEFTSMSMDIQEEYIKGLMDTYCATATNISEMFGIARGRFTKYIRDNELGVEFHVGHSMTKEQRDRWNTFLGNNKDTDPADNNNIKRHDDDTAIEDSCERKIDKANLERKTMRMPYFSFVFDGVVDPNMIANSIRQLSNDDAEYTVEIKCFRKDNMDLSIVY